MKLKNFVRYYIKGCYHCDTCPYCWGGGYNAGCDDYDDCGCYIQGETQDTCRLLPPVRFLLGYFKKKKALYHSNHEYDDLGEWYEQNCKKEDKLKELIGEYFVSRNDIWLMDCNGEPVKVTDWFAQMCTYDFWRIRSEYEDFAHPVVHVPLHKRWMDLISETMSALSNILKPYFCS